MDFGMMFKLGGMWLKFSKNHPKFAQFIKAFKKQGLVPDAVVDLKITYPDGNTIDTNLKITEDDLKMLEELKNMKK